jgi:hypothetical protein
MRKKKGIESVSLSEEIRQNLFILDCQQFFINIQKKKRLGFREWIYISDIVVHFDDGLLSRCVDIRLNEFI